MPRLPSAGRDIARGADSFGYHIIRRRLRPSKGQYVQAMQQGGMQAADSTYLAGLESAAKLEMKRSNIDGASVVEIPNTHLKTRPSSPPRRSAIHRGGPRRWMETFPPRRRSRPNQSAPDSLIPLFVKNFVRNELVLHAQTARKSVRREPACRREKRFHSAVRIAWTALRLNPDSLATAANPSPIAQSSPRSAWRTTWPSCSISRPQTRCYNPGANVLRAKYDYTINPERSTGSTRGGPGETRHRLHHQAG